MATPKTSEVVVIGGGIIGSSVAYHLAKLGIEVTLLERGDIASATSSSGDGNIMLADKMPGYDTRLVLESIKMYETLAPELGFDFEYRQWGSYLVIETQAEMEAAREYVKQQSADGLDFRLISPDEMRENEPFLAEDLLGAVESKRDGTLNPMFTTFAFARAARKLGAKIIHHNEVREIRTRNGEVHVVETVNGDIYTRKVVCAAGVWSPLVGKMVGLDIPITPRKGHLLVTEETRVLAKRKLMEIGYVMTKFQGKSLRKIDEEGERLGVAFVFEPTLARNYVIGSSRQFVGYSRVCSDQAIRAIAKRAIRYIPALRQVNIIRTYAGVRPYTPDHFPIISDTSVKGFYISSGHEGDGIGLAPITGKLTAELVTGVRSTIPLEPLAFSRFSKDSRHWA